MTASVNGRSRQRGRVHSSRSKTPPRHRTKAKPREDDAAAKPDLEDLRRKRLLYLSVPSDARRRGSAHTAAKAAPVDDESSRLKSTSSEHRRRKRKHVSRSSSKAGKAGKSKDQVGDRTTEYVYGAIAARAEERRTLSSDAKHPKSSGSSRRHSLPTVVETEIGPDDSVSQIGLRKSREPSKRSMSSSSSLKRSTTDPTKLSPISEKERDTEDRPSPTRRSSKRDSTPSLLTSLLRRNTAPAAPTPIRLVECLTCAADDVPYAKSAKLACGHRMCHDCLKRVFEMSITDPAHMPPKCCTSEHIPLKHVEKLFDLKFKMTWNRKYQEYHTKHRIYCPAPKCGEWIKPTHIHTYQGRKYAQCPKCQTKVCTLCHAKMHKSRECPKDPEIAKLVEQAKQQGWKACYNCNAMVELKEGCNHMTCRCLAEFCMVCGAKWKTCDCPWFNYNRLPDADRLNDWRVPEPIQDIFRRVVGDDAGRGLPIPPPARQVNERVENRRQRTYLEELEQRRRQERQDADLARRLHLATLLETDDAPRAQQRAGTEAWGIGNAAGHFLNEDFVQNAANVVMEAFVGTLDRRGERPLMRWRRARQPEQGESGRRRTREIERDDLGRRRPRETEQDDPGLAPNFLGDANVVDAGQTNSRSRPTR